MTSSAPAPRASLALSSVETVAIDSRAAHLRDLTEQQTDAARRRVHQAGVARAQRPGGRRQIMRRHSLQHRSCALLGGDAGRQDDEPRGRSHCEFGVGAGNARIRDPVADLHFRHAVADGGDRAARLEAEGEGKRRLVSAFTEVDIDVVEAGGVDLDQSLPGTRCRLGNIVELQRFWTPRLMNANRLHDRSPRQ